MLLVDTGERSDEEERAARTLGPEVDGLIVVSPRKLHRSLDDQAGTPHRVRQPAGQGTGIGRHALSGGGRRRVAPPRRSRPPPPRLRRRSRRARGPPTSGGRRRPHRPIERDRGRGHPGRCTDGRRRLDARSTSILEHEARLPSWPSTTSSRSGVIAGLTRRGVRVPRRHQRRRLRRRPDGRARRSAADDHHACRPTRPASPRSAC